jgi:hypothetical protein
MTLGNMCEQATLRAAAICVAVLVASCAESDLLSPYAAPGKYDYLDCPGINDRLKVTIAREQQLVELMSRANEGTGGAIVNAVAYRDDLNTARANIRELRKAAEAKHCPIDAATTSR